VEALVGLVQTQFAVGHTEKFKVVMKIIKHCSQAFPTPVTGFLVGMDKNATLEVTNAFPFPTVEAPPTDGYHDHNAPSNFASAAPRAKSNTSYQAEMISKLREVNVDANNTGWYTSTNLGHFIHSTFIENQYHYQKEMNERTVAIVHDVSRSSQGSLSLRAFRLSPSFMAAFKDNKFTAERYRLASFVLGTSADPVPMTASKNPTSATKTSYLNFPSKYTTRIY